MQKGMRFLLGALTVVAIAWSWSWFGVGGLWAAGGKMRLSEIRTDIDEMYLLCEQSGVRRITVAREGVEVFLECDPILGD